MDEYHGQAAAHGVAVFADPAIRYRAGGGELEGERLRLAGEYTSGTRSRFRAIGVNNRDLKTFEVTIETSLRLAPRIPAGVLKVAESGIHSAADIRRLRDAGYDAFLVGEHLMQAAKPSEALRDLMSGS